MQGTIRNPLARPGDVDPRSHIGETALVLASRNAFPVVATRVARKDGLGLVAGGAVALLLGGLTFWSMHARRMPPAPVVAVSPTADSISARPNAPAGPMAESVPPALPAPVYAPAVMPSRTSVDRAHAPIMVFDVTEAPALSPPASVAPAGDAGGSKAQAQQALGENDAFAQRMGAAQVESASATRMADPSNTVSQGTLIAGVLETAIDSDLPGYVRAVVSRDVRSFDGSKVLIPRSSRLIGQYKSGLAAGQTRAYVMWTRLIRPDGVSIALASPAVDYAGRSGLGGKVDGHFMKRFGSAMLLSVVGGLGALGTSGTSLVLSTGSNSAAAVAAQRDAQIPPTIHVHQGEPIRIFTARDLDFSAVAAGVEQ